MQIQRSQKLIPKVMSSPPEDGGLLAPLYVTQNRTGEDIDINTFGYMKNENSIIAAFLLGFHFFYE